MPYVLLTVWMLDESVSLILLRIDVGNVNASRYRLRAAVSGNGQSHEPWPRRLCSLFIPVPDQWTILFLRFGSTLSRSASEFAILPSVKLLFVLSKHAHVRFGLSLFVYTLFQSASLKPRPKPLTNVNVTKIRQQLLTSPLLYSTHQWENRIIEPAELRIETV